MKKREGEGFSDENPAVRRKAKLEREATWLMGLPKDIRRMIMMKLEPHHQFILYNEVTDQSFKQWCDEDFWNYALGRIRPVKVYAFMAKHPRWRYFTYVIQREMFKRRENIYFGKERPDGIPISVEMRAFEQTSLVIHVSRNWPELVMKLVEQMLKREHVPLMNISSYEDDSEVGIVFHEDSRQLCFELIFQLFSAGFSWHKPVEFMKSREDGTVFEFQSDYEINCHICGKVATGYSAENPTKLLCGPACAK